MSDLSYPVPPHPKKEANAEKTEGLQLKRIARISSDFPTKFGIPRQSGLVSSLKSTIIMEPEYRDGDTIIVQQQERCNSGDDCAVMVNGDDATFKRVRLHENGLTLQPLNTKYDPRYFTASEVESLPVRILGVVVEIRRKVKRS